MLVRRLEDAAVRMPPLATRELDQQAIQRVRDWIESEWIGTSGMCRAISRGIHPKT